MTAQPGPQEEQVTAHLPHGLVAIYTLRPKPKPPPEPEPWNKDEPPPWDQPPLPPGYGNPAPW